jgi:hypothetical protein
MTGGFDADTNALWTLCGKEAKSYDERIRALKDMDCVLMFVLFLAISLTRSVILMRGLILFAVVLTAFILDSKRAL